MPTTREEMRARGWDELDVLIVTGDAYVDHPAFGPVLVARFLAGRGLRVGIVAQPRWTTTEDVARMGRPRLFVGVSAGNLDSMLNKLTAQKKVRSEDQYSPGGRTEHAPEPRDARLREPLPPGLPRPAGRHRGHRGVAAAHRPLRLLERLGPPLDPARQQGRPPRLRHGRAAPRGRSRGASTRASASSSSPTCAGPPTSARTAARGRTRPRTRSRYVTDGKAVVLPSYEDVADDKAAFAKMSRMLQFETNAHNARPLLQPHGDEAVYFNPPALPLAESEMDALYDLPFVRRPHWGYGDEKIPAFETVKHSIVTMRGCFGGCTFCSITEHEGRIIQSRSADNVLREVRALSRMEGFRGTITDVGGPTANMYKMRCKDDETEHACRRLSCVHPGICENLVTDHAPLVDLLRRVRAEPGVERVYVASGVRYDLAARSPEFIRELARHHTGGQLSVAPEHTDPEVLDKMKKPPIEHYERFAQAFCQASEQAGKEQYLVPYFISGHPGSTIKDTIELGALAQVEEHAPAAGAGLHPDADGDRDDDVRHGHRPADATSPSPSCATCARSG